MALCSLFIWSVFITAVAAQTSFSTGNFQGQFASGSGVLESLTSTLKSTFDYIPSDYFQYRNASGNYHTGDITLRWRKQGDSDWQVIRSLFKHHQYPIPAAFDMCKSSTSPVRLLFDELSITPSSCHYSQCTHTSSSGEGYLLFEVLFDCERWRWQ